MNTPTTPINQAITEHLEKVSRLLPAEYKLTILFRHADIQPGQLRSDVVLSNDDIPTAARCLTRKVKEMRR